MFDADAVDALVVWEFQVKSGGKVYSTRSPQIGELTRMQKISDAGPASCMSDVAEWASALFVGEAPDIQVWALPQLGAFIAAYMAYFVTWSNPLQRKLNAAKTLDN